MGQPRPLFGLFLVFTNKQYNFYNKSMWKNVMSIQSMAPGFEPTTSQTQVTPTTTRPGLPPNLHSWIRFQHEILYSDNSHTFCLDQQNSEECTKLNFWSFRKFFAREEGEGSEDHHQKHFSKKFSFFVPQKFAPLVLL